MLMLIKFSLRFASASLCMRHSDEVATPGRVRGRWARQCEVRRRFCVFVDILNAAQTSLTAQIERVWGREREVGSAGQ